MCRWAAWIGAPVFLEHLVSHPGHSLIRQSQHAAECKTEVNADGFGVAWYGERDEPGLFRDVLPAWSDPNLRSLAAQVRSRLFLAHVRASTGTATSRNNCHPFVVGRWSFMHNGQIGGFGGFRRSAEMLVPDDLYPHRQGATDSELLFLRALAHGLDKDPCQALARAVADLEHLARQKGAAPHFRCAAALSDGARLFVLRYSSDQRSPTLYHCWDSNKRGRSVVSEPLEGSDGWHAIAEGSLTIFEGEGITVLPFAPFLQQAA
ncbi:MAG: class II glutamine amidotransferase [Pseudomonadota bacterium]